MKNLIKYNIEILSFLFFIIIQILIISLYLSSLTFILIYIFLANLVILLSLIDGTKKFKIYVKDIDIKKTDKTIYFYNQIIIPLSLFISTEIFLIINRFNITISEIIMLISLVLFYTSLRYIESYFEVFEFSEKAHYTINTVKLFIFFLSIYTLFEISTIINMSLIIEIIFVFLISFSLILMMMQRNKKYNIKYIAYSFLFSLIIIFISTLSLLYLKNALLTAFLLSLIFYIFENIVHHKIHKNLSNEIIIEYILIALIMFLIARGIFLIYV